MESKSLKLYLFSFRNHGDFHEDCVNIIMNDLIKLMDRRTLKCGESFCPAAAFPLTVLQLWQTGDEVGTGGLGQTNPP